MDRKEFGNRCERIAVKLLEGKGMSIVARNAHYVGGELDIVALDGGIVAIVEVKARSRDGVRPASAVTRAKIRHISRAALGFLSARDWLEREIRFDVVEVMFDGAEVFARHIPAAFDFDRSVIAH